MQGIRSEKIRASAFFLASTAILFFGFFRNTWHAAEADAFDSFQIGTESFIIGRIIKTARDGVFSAGGLPGLTGPDADPPDIEHANYRFQYQAYRDSLPFQTYTIYKSQIGGQGMLFGALNTILPFSSTDKLSLLRGLTSLLSAIFLGLILLWLYREFGFAAGAAALATAALSQWLTIFGKNLWWSIWAFYLPMVIVLYYLKRAGDPRRLRLLPLAGVVFVAVLLKCFFNGYEYITTTLIMMVVPYVYYSILGRTGWRKFLSGMAAAAASSVLAVLASMTALCLQVAAVEGSFIRGIDHILFSLLRRSYADPRFFPPDYAASLTANPFDVVAYYLREIYVDINYYIQAPNDFVANFLFQFRYVYLIVLFAVMSAVLLVLLRSEGASDLRPRSLALIAALWFSLLAPLSWLVIFKAHSYVHTFLNNIVWQMPFTLLGFAVCGLALRAIWDAARKNPS